MRLADNRVEEMVRKTLSGDSRIDLSEIHVHVQNGVVYLSGKVDSALEKRAARESLQAADIDQVVDQIELRNYVERTDAELSNSVKQALIRDIDVDARAISVSANAGGVSLSGRVDSYFQRNAAENIAWWTPGVIDVINRLEVSGSESE